MPRFGLKLCMTECDWLKGSHVTNGACIWAYYVKLTTHVSTLWRQLRAKLLSNPAPDGSHRLI